ncbi:MAG: hypothetical protein HOK28_02335 [Deltaproteobacteria bacterium]|jgi:hypothetical protein|nr:hypothetical protein [Deltaproteobacteria bacterium]
MTKVQQVHNTEADQLKAASWAVNVLDPLNTSAPVLHSLSDTLNFELRWFKTAEEIQRARPWKTNPKMIYLLSDKSPEVNSLELAYLIAEATNDSSIIWLLTESMNPNFREISRMAGVVGWLPTPLAPEAFTACLNLARSTELWKPPRGNTIQFKPKVGILNMNWNGSELVMQGVLDEKAEFTQLPNLLPKGLLTVRCNWNGLLTLNLEGLKLWKEFATSEAGASLQFIFEQSPRMMQEFWNSMPAVFGPNVRVELPESAAEEIPEELASMVLDETVKNLLTKGRRSLEPTDSKAPSLNRMYLGMLTSISRYALSELYLTQEAVLDLCSRMISRCTSIQRALPLTDITRTFDLPGRMPLIASILALYEPLLRTLVGLIQLLEAAGELGDGEQDSKPLQDWLNRATDAAAQALPWQQPQLAPLQTAMNAKLDQDSLIGVILQLAHTAIEGNLSTIDATGVTAFKLAKFEGPSPQVLANLSSQLRRASISAENIQPFRHECLLDWVEPVNPKSMSTEASKLILGTAQEARKIGHVLDTHDTLQQIFDHRKLELERLVRGASQEEIQEHLKMQAVTVLEKKVIGLYFKALAELADESAQLSGLQMFSAT